MLGYCGFFGGGTSYDLFELSQNTQERPIIPTMPKPINELLLSEEDDDLSYFNDF